MQEYSKLLERGVENVLAKAIAPKYIWIDDIRKLIESNICESTLPNLFINKSVSDNAFVFSLTKPQAPNLIIPEEFSGIIKFNELKNKFESDDELELKKFITSDAGIFENEKIETFKRNKEFYSKLYRAYNDIENDSNIEIVFSVGLIQHTKTGRGKGGKKINQHLFHFPLNIQLDSLNKINLSFSKKEKPYVDFFFLNSLRIEKNILNSIIDSFDNQIDNEGYKYIYSEGFVDLVSSDLQKISDNSFFESTVLKPITDVVNNDSFKISFSPSINIKLQKPRFFEKLTNGIIEENEKHNHGSELLNLLIRNPDDKYTNEHVKENYFVDNLYEKYKGDYKDLNAEEDFSTFFPLPFNKEQKQIYDNYLNNRLTVVTGPPGTGKSHTIVNVLCSLLAQGKRVLVTAQTDKALESLLDKIPSNFDDLVFTEIQLEVDKNRFSLEKSIDKVRLILTEKFHLNTENKISNLNQLKVEYLKLQKLAFDVLENEFLEISLNESFKNLRNFELWNKLTSKQEKEWMWLKDDITLDIIENHELIIENIMTYVELSDNEKTLVLEELDIDIEILLGKLKEFDFEEYHNTKIEIQKFVDYLKIDEMSKSKLLDLDLRVIIDKLESYNNSDIIILSFPRIKSVKEKVNKRSESISNITSNIKYSDLISNSSQYLRDIESYLAQINIGKEKISLLNKFKKRYKDVSYLEDVVLNAEICDSRSSLDLLKKYIKSLKLIDDELDEIVKEGFNLDINEDSDLLSKTELLNKAISKIERNANLLEILNNSRDIDVFTNIFNIELENVEEITRTATRYKDDLVEIKRLEEENNIRKKYLKDLSNIMLNSKLSKTYKSYLPLEEIDDLNKFKELVSKVKDYSLEVSQRLKFEKSFNFLKEVLPNTLNVIQRVPLRFITKENFEYAHANNFFLKNEIIDLQKTKEKLKQINNNIFEVKSEILYDLAKDNFKNSFSPKQIDGFINLLEKYKNNLYQGNRAIKDNIKFQILARNNSVEISEKLSCWVMKFNDVLNSVGPKPEVFDCIIVDEASQLDFNSLILGYYAKSMIVVGDDKQTSPTALTGANDDDFQSIKNKYLDFLKDEKIHIRSDNSLFSLSKMVAGSSNLTLKEHFRCVSETIEFSKYHFYDNQLKPLKQINTENRLEPIKSVYIQDSFIEDKIVYAEIESIKMYLIEILNSTVYKNKTVGVVSLGGAKHTEKLQDIKEQLSEIFGRSILDQKKLIIEDSPKFQGDERDVMLVSLGVALDSEKIKKGENPKPRSIVDDGKLKDEMKKINVALSRAKEQMILFHSVNADDLRPQDFRNKILTFFYKEAEQLKPFDLPENEMSRNKYNIPKPFDSWFEYDIAAELLENEFQYITPQYKVKEDEVFFNPKLQKEVYVNFRLDLVVSKNGKLVAIECDGDPYHTMPEDVAYDIERQEFLERVGWKIYRILYSAYQRNPRDEVNKMIEFVERNTKKDRTINVEFKKEIIDDDDIREYVQEYEVEDKVVLFDDTVNNENENNKIFEIEYVEGYGEEYFDLKDNNIVENPIISLRENQDNDKNEEELKSGIDKVLGYFNLDKSGTYIFTNSRSFNVLYSLQVKFSDNNGFLLLGYDNGYVNKVEVKSLFGLLKNKRYVNGLYDKAEVIFAKVIKNNELIGMHYYEDGIKKFKAHDTNEIPERKHLHLQGQQMIFNDFSNLKYEVLPMSIYHDIKKLVFKSYTQKGIEVNNPKYVKEWRILNISNNNELLFDFDSLDLKVSKVESIIDKAIQRNKKVRIVYEKNNGEISKRELTNLSMISKQNFKGESYKLLKADCLLRNDERHFKTRSIVEIEIIN